MPTESGPPCDLGSSGTEAPEACPCRSRYTHSRQGSQPARTIGTQRLRTWRRVQICRLPCASPVDNKVAAQGERDHRPTSPDAAPRSRPSHSGGPSCTSSISPSRGGREGRARRPGRGHLSATTTKTTVLVVPMPVHGSFNLLTGNPALVRNCRTCRLRSAYGSVDVGEAGGRARSPRCAGGR